MNVYVAFFLIGIAIYTLDTVIAFIGMGGYYGIGEISAAVSKDLSIFSILQFCSFIISKELRSISSKDFSSILLGEYTITEALI